MFGKYVGEFFFGLFVLIGLMLLFSNADGANSIIKALSGFNVDLVNAFKGGGTAVAIR